MHAPIRNPLLPRLLTLGACLAVAGLGPVGALRAQDAPSAPVADPQGAAGPASLREALQAGRWWVKLRPRYETVDDSLISKDAHASTLRTVLGYETGRLHGFAALLEFEDVSPLAGKDLYASPDNGIGNRPGVADPDSTELNQAYLSYLDSYVDGRLGRQSLSFDNQRFIGPIGWRQNDQTYDALYLANESLDSWQLAYAFVENVNRIVGEGNPGGDAPMASNLIHAQRAFENLGTLSLYAYLLDYDTLTNLSTDTFGLRFAGSHELDGGYGLSYTAEFATQADGAGNPASIDERYYRGELGGFCARFDVGIGYESLGGNGTTAFQTPLATLHIMNGWADKFLMTPVTGLVDLWAQAGAKLGPGKLQVSVHDFDAESTSASYGSEIDVAYVWPLAAWSKLGIKYADYDADTFSNDTTRGWLWWEYSF